MKKSLIIFDLDGTLINTLEDLNNAVNYALMCFKYQTRTLEQTRRDIGNGVAKLIERSIPNGINNPDYSKCLSTFKEYYCQHYFDCSFPYNEVKDTLFKLKEKGYRLAVVSNKFNEGANKLINFFFPNIFDYVQGHSTEVNYKPSSDMVNKVLKELNISNKDALYVGDTEVDYQTATNSKLDCILVSYGYRNKKQLLELTHHELIIDSLNQIFDYLF